MRTLLVGLWVGQLIFSIPILATLFGPSVEDKWLWFWLYEAIALLTGLGIAASHIELRRPRE